MFGLYDFAINALAFLGTNETSAPRAAKSSVSKYGSSDFGLKLLADGVRPTVDVVLVHGLDGHWKSSWTADNGVFWPQDFLSISVPQARIFSYGYDARTSDTTPLSKQYLHDHAYQLIADLAMKRDMTSTEARPIIFVAHSLGGIVLKVALGHSYDCSKEHLWPHKLIFLSTIGILFMGTPHQGADGASLKDIILGIQSTILYTDNRVSKHLIKNSEYLQREQERYTSMAHKFDTTFFYETLPMPIPGGFHKLLVPKYSAVIQGQKNSESIAMSGKDHCTMVKFESAEEDGMQKISWKIKRLAENASERLKANWASSEGEVLLISTVTRGQYILPLQIDTRKNYQFTGRSELLKKLHRALCPDDEGERSPIPAVLYGLGGIGKTQIAREYVDRHKAEYDSVHWFEGTSRGALVRGFYALARKVIARYEEINFHGATYKRLLAILKMDEEHRVELQSDLYPDRKSISKADLLIEAVRSWLDEDQNSNWLLIYDNVDDLSFAIEGYLPSSDHGNIIITTQRSGLAQKWSGIEVDQMTIDESLQLLRTSTDLDIVPETEEFNEALRLFDILGNLPLATVQAAAFIYNLRIPSPISEYIKIYDKNSESLVFLLSQTSLSEAVTAHDQTVFRTWEISFAALQRDAPEAAELLLLCSFFAKNDLREGILRETDHPRKSTSMQVLLMNLKSYSLIQRQGSADSFSIHPLVHYWARVRLDSESKKRFSRAAIRLLYNAIQAEENGAKNGVSAQVVRLHIDAAIRNAQEYLSLATDTIKGPPKVKASNYVDGFVLRAEGLLLWLWGLASEATQFLRRKFYNADFPHDWRIVYKLAYHVDDAQAEVAYIWCLNEAWHILPQKHPWALEIAGDLGWSILQQSDPWHGYSRPDRIIEARQWYIWTLNARQKVLGESHPATMGAILGIGEARMYLEQFSDALEMFQIALSNRVRALGASDTLCRNVIRRISHLFLRWKSSQVSGYEEVLLQYLATLKRFSDPVLLLHRAKLEEEFWDTGKDSSLASVGLTDCDTELKLWLSVLESYPRSQHGANTYFPEDLITIRANIEGACGRRGLSAALPLLRDHLPRARNNTVDARTREWVVGYEDSNGTFIKHFYSPLPEIYWIIDLVRKVAHEVDDFDAELPLLKEMDQIQSSWAEQNSERTVDSLRGAITKHQMATCLWQLGRHEDSLISITQARHLLKALLKRVLHQDLEVVDSLAPKILKSLNSVTSFAAAIQENLGFTSEALSLYTDIICLPWAMQGFVHGPFSLSVCEAARIHYDRKEYHQALGLFYFALRTTHVLLDTGDFDISGGIHCDIQFRTMQSLEGTQEQQNFAQTLPLLFGDWKGKSANKCQRVRVGARYIGATWISSRTEILGLTVQEQCPAIDLCPFLDRRKVWKAMGEASRLIGKAAFEWKSNGSETSYEEEEASFLASGGFLYYENKPNAWDGGSSYAGLYINVYIYTYIYLVKE